MSPARALLLGGLALAAGLLFLSGCHSVAPQRQLIITMNPPEFRPGAALVVTARPLPQAEMAYVSGTVNVMGFPDLAFSRDLVDGQWKFKTMIPIFASVNPGNYQVKAWGLSKAGQRYDGALYVQVK
jgi:hypothetical protein